MTSPTPSEASIEPCAWFIAGERWTRDKADAEDCRQRGYMVEPVYSAAEIPRLRAEVARMREALDRIANMTPAAANARDAREMHLTVEAIAHTALGTSA